MSFQSMNSVADVLAMNEDELARHRQLVRCIRHSIRTAHRHAISFAQFMEFALYHPRFGYYTDAHEVFGERGDFTTAPELGAVFGKILAVKIAKQLNAQQLPRQIYEFGAGTGKLAVQILSELRRLACDIDRYVIIEVSSKLKKMQQQTIGRWLPDLGQKVSWCDWQELATLHGIVIANEVLDAMPVELVRFDGGLARQGHVIESGNGFGIDFRSTLDVAFQRSCRQLAELAFADHYTSELHCCGEEWMKQVADKLQAGSIIITDYGFPQSEYYHPERREGTLICHRRHHSLHDPLAFIGCQDITAHLNYSLLAKVAATAGLTVNGFTTLGGFIVDIGLTEPSLTELQDAEQLSVTHQLNTLTSPAEMGELFKVMELTKNIDADRAGFAAYDQWYRL